MQMTSRDVEYLSRGWWLPVHRLTQNNVSSSQNVRQTKACIFYSILNWIKKFSWILTVAKAASTSCFLPIFVFQLLFLAVNLQVRSKKLHHFFSAVTLSSLNQFLVGSMCGCRRHFRWYGALHTAMSVCCFTWWEASVTWRLNILTERRLFDSCRRCSTVEWSSLCARWRWRWPPLDFRATFTDTDIAKLAVAPMKYRSLSLTKHNWLTWFFEHSQATF